MNTEELNTHKKKLQNRLYSMMIEIIFIFGIPAILAVFLGGKIDATLDSGRQWTIVALVVAFIVSWIFLVVRVLKIGKDLKEIDRQIKENKNEVVE